MNTLPLLLALVALLALAREAPATELPCDDPRVLRVGLIPKSHNQRQEQELRPLQAELERVLERRVEVSTLPSYGAVVEGLLSDSIDLAELGPASYAMLRERKASVVPIAALSGSPAAGPAVSGVLGTYRSVLVVRSDRGMTRVEELRSKSLSLTDPASTSGSLVPRQFIRQQTRSSIEHYFSRITFAGSHDRAIDAVRKGLVDAAFVSRTRFDEALKMGRIGAGELAILWQSVPLPLDPFVVRTRLCSRLIDKVRGVFFNPGPLRPLLQARSAERFVPVTDADYQAVHELFTERP